MLKVLVDENFDNDIVRGIIRQNPAIDLIRVQDVGLRGKGDPVILEWAAREGRILLTHDVRTIIPFATERVQAGKLMPGVFEVKRMSAFGKIIDELVILIEASHDNEWEGQIVFVPMT